MKDEDRWLLETKLFSVLDRPEGASTPEEKDTQSKQHSDKAETVDFRLSCATEEDFPILEDLRKPDDQPSSGGVRNNIGGAFARASEWIQTRVKTAQPSKAGADGPINVIIAHPQPARSRPLFRDVLSAAFDFSSNPDAYVTFGSFRMRVKASRPFSTRRLEGHPIKAKMRDEHFTCYASTGENTPEAFAPRMDQSANQFAHFFAGSRYSNLRLVCTSRGHGSRGAVIADWVVFAFIRRFLLSFKLSYHSDPEAAADNLSLREILKNVHSEIAEDLTPTFGEMVKAPRIDLETDTEDEFGASGATMVAAVTSDASDVWVLSQLGNQHVYLVSSSSEGNKSTQGPVMALHTMSLPGEKHRVRNTTIKAYARALADEKESPLADGERSGRNPRLIERQKLLHSHPHLQGMIPKDISPAREVMDQKVWIDKAIRGSAIRQFNLTRGFGFFVAQYLGIVSVPDIVEFAKVLGDYLLFIPSPRLWEHITAQEIVSQIEFYKARERSQKRALRRVCEWIRKALLAQSELELAREELTLILVPSPKTALA